jgi:hypothetical protein
LFLAWIDSKKAYEVGISPEKVGGGLDELRVQQNEILYIARFERPILGLWGEGRVLVQGLHDAFSPFGTTLADIRNESSSLNPADQVVAINIGLAAIHKFRFDRLETIFFNFDDETLKVIPSILEASTEWLRKPLPGVRFGSHQFTYSCHCLVEGKSADQVLRFAETSSVSAGRSMGSGVILNWELEHKAWVTKLLLDRSVLFPQGVFLMFTLTVKKDKVDYASLLGEGRTYLDSILRELKLKLP